MDILDDMVVSKLSANVFFKVNYSFNVLFDLFSHLIIRLDLQVNLTRAEVHVLTYPPVL